MKSRPCQPGDILVSKNFDYGIKYEIKVIEPTQHPNCGVTNDHDVKLQLAVFLPTRVLSKIGFIDVFGEETGAFWGVVYDPTCRVRTKIFSTRNLIDTIFDEITTLANKECRKVQDVVAKHEKSVLDQKNARHKIYSQIQIVSLND